MIMLCLKERKKNDYALFFGTLFDFVSFELD